MHVFHAKCIKDYIEAGWTTLNITFSFLNCPACKTQMEISPTLPIIGPIFAEKLELKRQIESMAMDEARATGLHQSERLKDPQDPYFEDWTALALASCTFYECFVCKEPYFGGMNDCRQAMLEERTTLKKHLRCKQCLSKELGFGDMTCKKHGDAYIDYKCRFCCNIALYVCFNGTHFCYDCHFKACNATL